MAYGNGGSYGEASAMVGTGYDSPKTARQPLVLQEVSRIESGVDVLHKTISELEARLGGVLTQSPPSMQSKDPNAPTLSATPLSDALASSSNRLHGAVTRLAELMQRLEI